MRPLGLGDRRRYVQRIIVMPKKVTCIKCSASILPYTYEKTGGYCVPCFQFKEKNENKNRSSNKYFTSPKSVKYKQPTTRSMILKILILTPLNLLFVLWALAINEISGKFLYAFISLIGLSLFNVGTVQPHRSKKSRILLSVIGCLIMFIIVPLFMTFTA